MPDSSRRRHTLLGWTVVVVAWLVWGAINSARLRAGLDLDWTTAVWFGLPDAIIWAALTPVIVVLTRRLFASDRTFIQTMPIHIGAAVAVAVAHTTLDTGVTMLRGAVYGHDVEPLAMFRHLMSHAFHLNVLVYFLIASFTAYLLSVRRLERRDRHAAELRAQLTASQLALLKSQLRPHFLFNALHTISAHLRTDPEVARRVLRQLGVLLRISLRNDGLQTVPLRQELELTDAYLDVESARFGPRLAVERSVDESLLDAQVPALLLQPLVENAVHHGVSMRTAGGTVKITAERVNGSGPGRLRLSVEDDGPGLDPSGAGDDGVGLRNSRERLEVLYGDQSMLSLRPLEPHGVAVDIELPLSLAESDG